MTLIIPESAIFRSTRLTVRCIIFQKISVQNGWMPLVARIGSGHTSKSLLITTLRALIALQQIHAIQCYRCGKSCYNLRILNTYFSFLAILMGFKSLSKISYPFLVCRLYLTKHKLSSKHSEKHRFNMHAFAKFN